MKTDTYITEGRALTFPRGEVPAFGEMPDVAPIAECAEDDYEPNEDSRVFRLRVQFRAEYLADLLKRARNALAEVQEHGGAERVPDAIARTLRGGGEHGETLYTFATPLRPNTADGAKHLWYLVGLADSAHELGVEICFDKDWNLSIHGARFAWLNEEEC